jgi:hypothetical protein
MTDIIYHDKNEARAALIQYQRELEALQGKYDIREECEDSDCPTYAYVKVYAEGDRGYTLFTI